MIRHSRSAHSAVRALIGLPVLSFALIAACAARPATPMENEATGAENYQAMDRDGAGDAVAVARCHHEKTCGRVGQGQAFATRRACEQAYRAETRAQIPACKKYDAIVLQQCLGDIRDLGCSDMVTVESVESCRASRLCAL
jgi:hypothetical protein